MVDGTVILSGMRRRRKSVMTISERASKTGIRLHVLGRGPSLRKTPSVKIADMHSAAASAPGRRNNARGLTSASMSFSPVWG